jgi:Zn-dependent peptidase ImmA (M78 family)
MPYTMLQTASDAGIKVEYFSFVPPMQGIYLCEDDMPPIIGLDSTLQHSMPALRCVLAEELGHHFTSAGYCLPRKFYSFYERNNITRAEYKALKWAANYLMPEHDLLDVIRDGLYEKWEIAEYFNVTEDFAMFRLRLFGVRNL